MAKQKQSFKQDTAEILGKAKAGKAASVVKTISSGPAAAAPVYKKPDPMKVINLRIPESLRTRAELQAVKQGVTLSRFIREALENAVDAAELQE